MKHFILVMLLLIISKFTLGQNFSSQTGNKSLSLIILTDYDKYKFNSFYSEHAVHLSGDGLGKGVSILYERRDYKHLAVDIGAGYYQYGFNILRNINDPMNPIDILYSTKKYYCNCLSLSAIFNYVKSFHNGYILKGGIGYTYYYTFSQKYEFPRSHKVITKASSYPFANSIYLTGGLEKSIGNYGVEILFNFPVWENWRKDDEVFLENQYKNEYHSKIDHGIGIGIKGSYYF